MLVAISIRPSQVKQKNVEKWDAARFEMVVEWESVGTSSRIYLALGIRDIDYVSLLPDQF